MHLKHCIEYDRHRRLSDGQTHLSQCGECGETQRDLFLELRILDDLLVRGGVNVEVVASSVSEKDFEKPTRKRRLKSRESLA